MHPGRLIAHPAAGWTLLGTGPALWWDFSDAATVFADTGGTTPASDGGVVALVRDKSGHGVDGTQATVGSQPIWASAGTITTDGLLQRIGGSIAWTAAQTLIVAFQSLSATSTLGRLASKGNTNGFLDASGVLKWNANSAAASVSTGINIRTAAKVATFRRADDTAAVLRVNGVETNSFTPHATQQNNLGIGTVSSASATNPCATKCWQVAYWTHALSAGDLAAAEAYLGAKAGLSW